MPSTPDSRLVAPKDLGDAVRQLRTSRGLSRVQAAALLGVEPQEIARVEQSSSAPMVRTCRRIVKGLTDRTLEGPFYRLPPADEAASP